MNLLKKKEFFFYIFLFIFISYLSNYIFASEFTNPNIYIGWFQKSLYELRGININSLKIASTDTTNISFIILISL